VVKNAWRKLGGTFYARYKEHVQDIQNNRDTTSFSLHILITRHDYGKIGNTMMVFDTIGKGPHVNSMENFYIQKIANQNLQPNDTLTEPHNPIFEVLLQHY
jgi:hypothetical protein